jgi:hypothetical protein
MRFFIDFETSSDHPTLDFDAVALAPCYFLRFRLAAKRTPK